MILNVVSVWLSVLLEERMNDYIMLMLMLDRV